MYTPLISYYQCGDKRGRTADLLNAIQALSQLSYIPIANARAPNLFMFMINAKQKAKICY